jgi:5,10-methylenetetrahydromethanopterin reductase
MPTAGSRKGEAAADRDVPARPIHPRAVGVFFRSTTPIAELPEFARRVETLGYDELWVAEDCFAHGGIAAAATALAVTSRLAVGIGLLPAAVRNPAVLAMELSSLAQLAPGRVTVAMGHGVESWMRQISARPADRVAALDEIVRTLAELLRGQTVTRSGSFVAIADVRLDDSPKVPPAVLVGSTGPRGIAVARDRADGLLMPEGSTPAAIASARDALGPAPILAAYAWLGIDADGDRARAGLVPTLQEWSDWALFPGLVQQWDLPDDGAVATEIARRAAVAGTPQDCAAAVDARFAAGASSVILWPDAAEPWPQLEAFASTALPLVDRGR